MKFYLPIIAGPYSNAASSDWIQETPLSALSDRETVLKEIWAGQYEGICRVWVINLTVGTAADVTVEIADALAGMSWDRSAEPYKELRDFIELNSSDPIWSEEENQRRQLENAPEDRSWWSR